MWLAVLSDQLPIVALVGRYLTNKLIGRTPLRTRPDKSGLLSTEFSSVTICGISSPFGELSPTFGQVTYVLLTRSPLPFRPKAKGPFDLHA